MAEEQRDIRGRLVTWFIEIPGVIVIFVMMAHVVYNALSRTFANAPVANTLEMVENIYLPIVALLGFVAAQHRGQHVAAELVFQAIPSVTRRVVLACVMVLCAALTGAFAWFGVGEALHRFDIGQTAGLSDIPSWWVYFLVPAAFGALACQFLYGAWLALTGEAPDVDPTGASHDLSDVRSLERM